MREKEVIINSIIEMIKKCEDMGLIYLIFGMLSGRD